MVDIQVEGSKLKVQGLGRGLKHKLSLFES